MSAVNALHQTAAGSAVRTFTPAPAIDGWGVVERLLEDLASLRERIWLVVDDAHELRSSEAGRQLELLLMRSPPELRFVLVTRHDLPLGLHRLRLEGELTEIRAADLCFTLDDARALFTASGIELSELSVARLVERTEGWAAGLRLAALSLVGHRDPERFAAEFSGSERTVAEYLLAEVLDRQPDEVRRLLLRTSILTRFNGPLADRLTGGTGAERVLHALERTNAFVVSLDGRRSWFRYHSLFAELLQLELRRAEPDGIRGLHAAAASWYADNGYPVEAIRHAQAAQNWVLGGSLLSDNWFSLILDGEEATAHELLVVFPPGALTADPALCVLAAADGLVMGGPLDEAESRLALAAGGTATVPEDRRQHFQTVLTLVRLFLARQRGNLSDAVVEAERLLPSAGNSEALQVRVDDDVRATALVNLGVAERFSMRFEEAEYHLSRGVALARRAGRAYLEVDGLAAWAMVAAMGSSPRAAEKAMEAIELAEVNGWSELPAVVVAYLTIGATAMWRGRLHETESWLERAERALRPETQPGDALMVHYHRGLLELARGRNKDALAALRPGALVADQVVELHSVATKFQAVLLHTLVHLGETQRAEATIAGMDDQEGGRGETRTALAELRLAQGIPEAATTALAPVLDGSVTMMGPVGWSVQPFLLESIAREALGDAAASEAALERALDIAEPDGAVLAFLLHPAPVLLERHLQRRTAHRALLTEILDLLAGSEPKPLPGGRPPRLPEPLSQSETRVLRYLPTNLSAPEIANEMYLSVNTVKTHLRHLYDKLGAHRRREAVERARALGLLAPSSRHP
jgi:LuxR family maltose regulon positive regulatory protein